MTANHCGITAGNAPSLVTLELLQQRFADNTGTPLKWGSRRRWRSHRF
ncbi:MAG: hypothetical protein R2795_23210 [Saprospiraceae bacterium]